MLASEKTQFLSVESVTALFYPYICERNNFNKTSVKMIQNVPDTLTL